MSNTPTLDVRGGRLLLLADEDDYKIVTFRVPFDPTTSTWVALWRDRNDGGNWGEFDVAASGTENTGDDAGTWNITVEVDTTDFGEAARVWALFRDGEPWISGPFVTQATPDRGAP